MVFILLTSSGICAVDCNRVVYIYGRTRNGGDFSHGTVKPEVAMMDPESTMSDDRLCPVLYRGRPVISQMISWRTASATARAIAQEGGPPVKAAAIA